MRASLSSAVQACTAACSGTASHGCQSAKLKPLAEAKFAPTEIGYVHIDIAELRLAQGKLNMFLAINRVSKFSLMLSFGMTWAR